AGADQQRLGDLGSADLVGVGGGAAALQVQADDIRPPLEALGHTGEFEPGGEESGNLGALAGSSDDKHVTNTALRNPSERMRTRTKLTGRCLWPSYKIGAAAVEKSGTGHIPRRDRRGRRACGGETVPRCRLRTGVGAN